MFPNGVVGDYVQKPTFIALAESARNAAKIMAENDSSSAIITLNGQAVGIMTEWDIITRLVILGKDSGTTPVSEVMSAPLWTVPASTKVKDAVSLMLERGFRRLVIKNQEKVLGVISMNQITGNRREQSIPLPLLELPKGDLCPFCQTDFGSREELVSHVQLNFSKEINKTDSQK